MTGVKCCTCTIAHQKPESIHLTQGTGTRKSGKGLSPIEDPMLANLRLTCSHKILIGMPRVAHAESSENAVQHLQQSLCSKLMHDDSCGHLVAVALEGAGGRKGVEGGRTGPDLTPSFSLNLRSVAGDKW